MEQREIEVRATRALERRFGQSVLCDYRWNGTLLTVTDRETGSYVIARASDTGRARLVVTFAHDGA